MRLVGVVLEPAVLVVRLLVNALGQVAVMLAEDAEEERLGLFDLLEAEVQRFVVVGLLSGTTLLSIRNPHSQFRNWKAPQRRSMSTK